jgi:hypothetical protein
MWMTMALAAAGAAGGTPWTIVCTETPKGAMRAARGEGGRIVLVTPGGAVRNLTAGFASAADPAVSFDGSHILFAAKKSASDSWDIYEMAADGSGARQITHHLGNCRSPVYQSRIFYLDDPGPMPQIAFTSDTGGESGEWGRVTSTALYSARMDGSGVRRLTYNPSGAFDPAMLPDGRMLFSAWRTRSGTDARPAIDLAGINIDGTDYAAFSGVEGLRTKRMACVTAKREVIFVEPAAQATDGAGPLSAISLRRNLHTWRRVTLPADGMFLSPAALPDGTVLVARKPAGASGTYGIWRLDPATRKLEPVFDTPQFDEWQAQALVAREAPDGRSSVVDEKQPWAKLYCLNIYESDIEARNWERGLVKRVRILEGIPRAAAAATLSPLLYKRFIGEFDIDEDGSFHTQIPANVPVEVQALDAQGMALRTSAWIWAKNKEQRGCIGCHEDGERTPENVMASALTHPAVNLMLAGERRRVVDFERDVAPVLRARCATAACHAGAAAPRFTGKGVRFGAAYEALLAKNERGGYRYVVPGQARTSPLVWMLFGRNTSRPWDPGTPAAVKAMPPAGAPRLTSDEKRAIIEWIDLGAHYGQAGGGQR